MSRRVITSTRYLLAGLWSLRRLGRQRPRPTDVVCFEGQIVLEPPDAFTDGRVLLKPERGRSVELVAHLFDELDVPREDDLFPHATFYGRVVVEVLPDPDIHWFT